MHFFNVFIIILPPHMLRALSFHHQESQIVLIQHLVLIFHTM